MKYEGHELKEIDTSVTQVFDPPKKMLVWDSSDGHDMHKNTVCAIIPSRVTWYKVVTEYGAYTHCAELPEQPVTQRELARWLAQGNGEVKFKPELHTCYTKFGYIDNDGHRPVPQEYTVRKFEDTEWHSVTREYLGLTEE